METIQVKQKIRPNSSGARSNSNYT